MMGFDLDGFLNDKTPGVNLNFFVHLPDADGPAPIGWRQTDPMDQEEILSYLEHGVPWM